jgi:peptidoglycan/LPS O-acetylase OafA/YrhL
VAVVLVIGVVLSIAGLVLLLNLFGAADEVIRRVTSRSLGELAPGFAASRRGFRIYAVLVLAVGILCVGLAATAIFLPLGAGLLVLGAVVFGIASVIAIVGEVDTYRALKR